MSGIPNDATTVTPISLSLSLIDNRFPRGFIPKLLHLPVCDCIDYPSNKGSM